jgi:hypothetical protein
MSKKREAELNPNPAALASGAIHHYAPPIEYRDVSYTDVEVRDESEESESARPGKTNAGWHIRLASTSAEQLQATRPTRHAQRPSSTLLEPGIALAARTATIPWQSAHTQVSVVAIDPGGTACPPVHRNGTSS